MVFQNDILAGAAGAGGYTIDQSIRFNDDDSAFLTKTWGSGGDSSKTATISFWMKRGDLGREQMMFAADTNTNTDVRFVISSGDKLQFIQDVGGVTRDNCITSAVFRDVSAWYHILLRLDSTQASASDRIRMYVNGEQQTYSSENQAGLNENFTFNGNPHFWGRQAPSAVEFFDGYLSEINFLDGISAAPTEFAEYNDDGVWIPKQYAGSYGTNGYYLTGADSADLGADESGNGNDFTSSGLTTSSQVTDTPTDNYCVLNDLVQNRAGGLTNSDGIRAANLQLYRPSASANSFGSGTMAVYGGVGSPKLYYEVYTSTYPGGNVLQMYIEEATDSSNSQPANSFGLNQRHTTSAYRLFIYPGGSETPASWTSEFGQGVYVGLAVDFANDEISANVDGTEIFSYDAAELAVLSGITTDTFAGRWWRPKIQVANDAATIIDVNFGQNAFQNAPAGYVGWSTSAIPTPTIKDGSAHFQTSLWTGNTSTQEINQTGNSTFQPDLVWIKLRGAATHHVITDAVRGNTKSMASNLTNAEQTATDVVTSFDADGFTLGDGSELSYGAVNSSPYATVGWQWLAGNGTASNSDGDITSTVSANTTAGFSIVSYTGNGSASQTVGHGLGVTPKTVIIKPRSSADNWLVSNWETGVTAFTEKLKLNANEAASSSSNQIIGGSSTTFTIGTDANVNGSGTTYIAYCWNEVEGFSKFGSYTGNGSADGPFVQCNFRPAFIIVKPVTGSGDWVLYDSTRDPENVAGRVLRPDSSAAEFDGRGGSRDVDFLSNGFKFRSSNGTMNGSGVGYLFMAFAEHPFGGTGVAPVPAR